MVRKPTGVVEEPDETLDPELDPGADAEALARLEAVGPHVTDGDAWVNEADAAAADEEQTVGETVDPDLGDSPIVGPPKKSRARTRRKPPANIGEPILSMGVTITQVSVGKSISNVTASLTCELDVPRSIREYMGEHAYAATFRGDYLGEGMTVKTHTESVDPDLRVKSKFKVMVPRYNNGVDQIATYILPLLPDALPVELLELSSSWRLNVTVEIGGILALYELQQAFDLTAKAEPDPGTTYEKAD